MSPDILGTLEVGQAVVKLQGRIARPFLISIPEFGIEKGRVTDQQIREYMKDRIPQFVTEDRAPDGAAAEQNECTQNDSNALSDGPQIAFLKDVADHPDSGVAVRYKRLGLSGRQGQKVKLTLLEQGLIAEHLETTRTGRRMMIQLTEEGQRTLSHSKKAA